MIFNSLTYLLLLFIVVVLYWQLSFKFRLLLIFSSSLIFYGFWKIEFIPVLLLSVVVDWLVAQKMVKSKKQKKFLFLLVSLITNLGLLFYFKYLIFFAESSVGFANLLGAELDPFALKIILPLGISFYTFQTISYTVDVYRGFIKPERNFIIFACYVTFFPQLVAGPILRASEVMPQFANRPIFTLNYIFTGIRLILIGLFLKTVLADNLSILVDSGFSMEVENISALDVWTLAFLFGFQIYFDFSGYSFIALGSARMMGIIFPNNFDFPYVSSSPKEFWQRWHISLSSWIRDYLYLPLNKAKVINRSEGGLEKAIKIKRNYKSLFFTMSIMGFWHGANWTFLIWGVYHALIISLYRLIVSNFRSTSKIFQSSIGMIITLPVMMLSWIPFRSTSLENTFNMLFKLFNPSEYMWLGMRENTYLIAFLVLIGFFLVYLFKVKILPIIKLNKFIFVTCDAIFIMLVTFYVIIFFRSINQFIYFQF